MSQVMYRVNDVRPPLGSNKWNGMNARVALSQYVDSLNDDSISTALFHHDGKQNIQAVSSLRYRGGLNGFGITVVDDIDPDLQYSIVKTLMQYAIDNEGTLDVKNLHCDIEKQATDASYHSILVIGRSSKTVKPKTKEGVALPSYKKDRSDFNLKIRNDESFRDEQIKWEIVKGISRQFQSLFSRGKVSIKQGYFLGRVIDGLLDRDSAQQFMDSMTLKKVEELPPAKRYLPRYFVEFKMPVNLSGDWAAGKMNHKGYGHLIKLNTNKAD